VFADDTDKTDIPRVAIIELYLGALYRQAVYSVVVKSRGFANKLQCATQKFDMIFSIGRRALFPYMLIVIITSGGLLRA